MSKFFPESKIFNIFSNIFHGSLVTLASFPVLIYGPGLPYVQKLKVLKKNDQEIELDRDLTALIDSVIFDVKLSPSRKDIIKFFYSNDSNVVSYGSLLTIWGTLIGLPYYFSYTKLSDINLNHIKLASKYSIDWKSKSGKMLLNSFILSDAAKKFAMAKEIHFADSFRFYGHCFIVYFCGLTGFFLTNFLLKKNGIINRPFLTLSPIYSLSIFVTYILYLVIQGIADDYIHHEVDLRTIKSYNKDYINGGIEYYQKLLQRNKALRDLLGEKGLQMYNPDGDEISTLFEHPQSLVKKIEFLKKFKIENEKKFLTSTPLTLNEDLI